MTIVLEELVARDERRRTFRAQQRLTLAYPALLLAFMVALYVLASWYLVPQMARVFKDFGTTLPLMTKFAVAVFSPLGGLIALVVLAIVVAAGILCHSLRSRAVWAQEALYAVPLVGPRWRYEGLTDLATLMAILLDQEVPLPQALRVTAEGLQEADLKEGCRLAADAVESGTPLSECVRRFPQFHRGLEPLVEWGERMPALADSFRAATTMFDAQAQVRSWLIDGVILPLAVVIVVVFVGFFILALFLPLLSLIQMLT